MTVDQPVSKVLVLDDSRAHAATIKRFCDEHNLVGMTVRRNRLLSLNQSPQTDYVDPQAVAREVAYARRMFADNGWPVIDVTRRSIEETAAAIIALAGDRQVSA